MKRVLSLLVVLSAPAWAQGMTSNSSTGSPGYVNAASAPPPMAVPGYPAPSSVINAVPGVPPAPMQIIGVPVMPPPPIIAHPAPPPSKPAPVSASDLARGPQRRAAPQGLVKPADYPPAALAMRAAGRVAFLLTVGTDGRVVDCAVTRSSGSPTLDRATCNIMRRRQRFTPAIDRHGNPAVAAIAQEVDWKLP